MEEAKASSTTTDSQPTTPPRRRRGLWLILGAVVLIGGAFVVHARSAKSTPAAGGAQDGAAGGRGGRGGGAGKTPVLAATVRKSNVDEYLSGLLGTAVSLNTVTVHSRVDGQLITVAFKEGQLVHQGDLLAEIDPRPFQVQLEQAEGQKNRDEAQLKNANLDLERYKVLFSQDSIAKQQLDTQQATVTQDEAVITTDQAQIDTAKLNLTYSRITSPISGRIGLRLVDPGNIVHATDTNGLVVITQTTPIAVNFPIPEDQLPRILPKVRAGTKLVVDAYDRDPVKPGKLASGSVLTLDNQVNVTTGTVMVKAVFPNTDEKLFPNQFVNARLLVRTLQNAIIVPSAAIQRGPSSTYVFVVKPDNTVDMRTVEVQLTQGDDTIVSKGVTEGETVVTDGLDKLQPGSAVQVRPATPASGNTTAPAAGTDAAQSSSGSPSTGTGGRGGRGGRP